MCLILLVLGKVDFVSNFAPDAEDVALIVFKGMDAIVASASRAFTNNLFDMRDVANLVVAVGVLAGWLGDKRGVSTVVIILDAGKTTGVVNIMDLVEGLELSLGRSLEECKVDEFLNGSSLGKLLLRLLGLGGLWKQAFHMKLGWSHVVLLCPFFVLALVPVGQ